VVVRGHVAISAFWGDGCSHFSGETPVQLLASVTSPLAAAASSSCCHERVNLTVSVKKKKFVCVSLLVARCSY
jgi:hypothetical protein